MNILIPDSWLRDYLDTDASPQDIQKSLSLCGPSIERLHHQGDDYVYDVEVTTNRVDTFSVYGLAREAVAILPQFGFKAVLKPLKLGKLSTGNDLGISIINDPKLCKRILAVKVTGVTVGPSPEWLQKRLELVGQRPLNSLVDITNYVMWDVGHPTHVFDYDRLVTGKMLIREAKKGEQLTTLDEKIHTLLGGEVVIDDGTGRIIDLPSIMGTANSVVTDSTRTALFFVDDVVADKVRKASMNLGIRTQAATIIEKDIDPQSSWDAIAQAVQLCRQLIPQSRAGEVLDINDSKNTPKTISLPIDLVSRLIGVTITKDESRDILKRLGFKVVVAGSILSVTPPNWRSADISIPEDVVEEIARIYGYHNIPSRLMEGEIPSERIDSIFRWESKFKTALKYLGFNEVYTYSLLNSDPEGLKLTNPLTNDWAYLRTSLVPSHKLIIDENSGRVENLNFFEIADVYLPSNGNLPKEESRLIMSTNSQDYYHFKGTIEALLEDLNIRNIDIKIESLSGMFAWEISMEKLLGNSRPNRTYTPISKYTPVYEDINVLQDRPYAEIEKSIFAASHLIKQIGLVDKFNDKLTLRLTFHSETKQLSSEDIAPVREKLQAL